jgi:amino acid transporter
VAWCIGLLSSALVGYDGATHLGEEIENAAMGIPFTMVRSVVAYGVMGFGFLIALLFCMGDIDSALNTNTGFPIIQIFYTITGNKAAAAVMVVSGLPLLCYCPRT